jgi:hypothetical protein
MRVRATLTAAMLLAGLGVAQERVRFRPIPKNDMGLKTGPEVGGKIPAFEAPDQHGRKQNFDSLKGANGLMLLFVRSADW